MDLYKAPFYITVQGLGTVGGQQPTALYAEVEDPRTLKTLNRQVTRIARVEGVEIPHAGYSPGITLATFDDLGQHDMKMILSFCSRRAGLSAGPKLDRQDQTQRCTSIGSSCAMAAPGPKNPSARTAVRIRIPQITPEYQSIRSRK